MALTLLTGSFINSIQFTYYADSARICQLLSDDPNGVPIPLVDLPTNDTLSEILRDATQEILEACTVGNRYTVDQLNTLNMTMVTPTTFNPNPEGASLRKLTAALAWGTLVDRRKYTAQQYSELAPSEGWAQQKLELLRSGQRIFNIAGFPEAGLPGVEVLGINANWYCPGDIITKTGLWGNIAWPINRGNPAFCGGCGGGGSGDLNTG